jgi:hypothetical protein
MAITASRLATRQPQHASDVGAHVVPAQSIVVGVVVGDGGSGTEAVGGAGCITGTMGSLVVVCARQAPIERMTSAPTAITPKT